MSPRDDPLETPGDSARGPSREARPLAGIFWMLVTGLFFVGVTGVVKHLGPGIPAAQSAFLRYLIGLIFFLPFLRPLMRVRLSRASLVRVGWRGLFHTVGVALWFYAMARIPIAEVAALNYLSPIYVTIGAALFLGERIAAPRVLAVLVGLLGAVVILRPGFRELSGGHLAMLGTGLAFSASYLIAKRITDDVAPTVVVAMLSITVTIGLAPLAALDWVPVTTVQLGWLCLVAFFATAGHYTMTLALRAAPVTVTQPVTFLQLVWSVLLGVAVFSERIDPYVIAGGLVIIASVSFITFREAMKRRARKTPPVPPLS